MQTVEVMGESLAIGDSIVAHGFIWTIDSVTYDPKGNTGNQPRYLVNAHWSGNGAAPPPGYRKGTALGKLVCMKWSRVLPW